MDRVATWSVALPSEEDGPPLDLGAVLRAEARAMAPVPDWTCPCCGQRAGTRRLTHRTAPDCLVIQLLRFARSDGTTRKLTYPVEVPVNGLSIETTSEGCCTAEVPYSLRAFATHTGGLLEGHYEAFVGREGKWWAIDDAQVTEVALAPQGAQAAVYALFLQRTAARCTAVCGRLEDDAPCPVQCWHPQGHRGFHSFECLHTLPPDPPTSPPPEPEGA